MIAPSRNATSRSRVYRSGWLVVVLAFTSYLLVAVAEQGGTSAGLDAVPEDPLPFDGNRGIGLDLSEMSSLNALEWLEGVSVENSPLVVLPVDGDIVAAFYDPETFGAATTAVDSLVGASGETRVALCLKKPVSAVEEAELAEAAITVIVEDYTDKVAYLSTCPGETSNTWDDSIFDLLGFDAPARGNERLLAPVSIGAPLRLPASISSNAIDASYIDSLAGDSYIALTLDDQPLVQEPLRTDISRILTNRAHVALTLARPAAEVPPEEFVASLGLNPVSQIELAEGYNDILSSAMTFEGEWTLTEVGPVVYQRTGQNGARVSAQFVGTEVWAIGLTSPGAGSIGVWLDSEGPVSDTPPDNVVDLSGTQAVDNSFLLVDNLSAATHDITIVASDGDVALAGLFVTGRPEGGWHASIGAFGILFTAMAGLAVVISVAIDDLRLRIGLDRPDDREPEHPRIFRREL